MFENSEAIGCFGAVASRLFTNQFEQIQLITKAEIFSSPVFCDIIIINNNPGIAHWWGATFGTTRPLFRNQSLGPKRRFYCKPPQGAPLCGFEIYRKTCCIGESMLNELVRLCDERYQSHRCESCSYGIYCPHDCEKCLEYIHFPQKAPVDRKYDCKRMMDFYVCKYAHKYTSELVYAFSKLRDLRSKRHLNVLSIGCGPCTDLLALDYLVNEGAYCVSTIDYRGVDINTEIWSNVYNDLSNMIPRDWSFEIIPEDICDCIDILIQQNWRPDLIVMQYVFSDMHKHTQSQKISSMIKSLAQYIDSCERNTYVVCNDINLSIDFDGGREYFDRLYNRMCTRSNAHRFHFNNSNKPRHYDYGNEYETNDLFVLPSDDLDCYQPYKTCASAQMIIKKEE